MCSGSFSQSLPPLPITQVSQSQVIGEDILAMCTGKFYENEFVSQAEENIQTPLGASQQYDTLGDDSQVDKVETHRNINHDKDVEAVTKAVHNNTNAKDQSKIVMDDNLKSILDELDDPEFDTPKPNRFFYGAKTQKQSEDTQELVKKKLIIDSDEDTNDASETRKRKKLKKKKPEKRALQISGNLSEYFHS